MVTLPPRNICEGRTQGMLVVRKHLLEALRAERRALPVHVKAGQSSTEELQVLLRALVKGEGEGKESTGEDHERQRGALRHRALMELVTAVSVVLDRSHTERWEVRPSPRSPFGRHPRQSPPNEISRCPRLAWSSLWQALGSTERMIAQSADGDSEDVASALVDVLKQVTSTSSSALTVDDAVALLVGTYALLGASGEAAARADNHGSPFTFAQELALQDALAEAVVLRRPAAPAPAWLAGLQFDTASSWPPREDDGTQGDAQFDAVQLRLEVKDRVEAAFERLRSSAAARTRLQPSLRSCAKPLLRQLVEALAAKADLPDVTHAPPVSLGGFLKSGLGRIGMKVVQELWALSEAKVVGTGRGCE